METYVVVELLKGNDIVSVAGSHRTIELLGEEVLERRIRDVNAHLRGRRGGSQGHGHHKGNGEHELHSYNDEANGGISDMSES